MNIFKFGNMAKFNGRAYNYTFIRVNISEYRLKTHLFDIRGNLADCCLIACELEGLTISDCIAMRDAILNIIG